MLKRKLEKAQRERDNLKEQLEKHVPNEQLEMLLKEALIKVRAKTDEVGTPARVSNPVSSVYRFQACGSFGLDPPLFCSYFVILSKVA